MSTLVVTNLSLGAGGLPNGSVLTDDIADNAITTAKIAAGAVVAADLSGNQTGSAPIYGARAWVNFNGTGTVAIRASGNVLSVTDNGLGDYTVTFITAMPDTNYVVSTCQADGTTVAAIPYIMGLTPGSYSRTVSITTSSVRLYSTATSGNNYDAIHNFVAILR